MLKNSYKRFLSHVKPKKLIICVTWRYFNTNENVIKNCIMALTSGKEPVLNNARQLYVLTVFEIFFFVLKKSYST